MNRLSISKRAYIIGMMVEGMSIRAITRLEGVSKNTIIKLLENAGQACIAYQDHWMRELPCKRVQVDEIWSFVYAKSKNVPSNKIGEAGDVWTWTAICADTKIVPTWLVGQRDLYFAKLFMADVQQRMAGRIQLSSDGLVSYPEAVEDAFGDDVDYARTIKVMDEEDGRLCIGTKKHIVKGKPDPKAISTSFMERQNLNIRMGNRRFTRLTNAFSKKIGNHNYALAIYFMHYNFVRIHQTLRMSPAMAAGVSSRLWSLEDLVKMIDKWEVDKINFWKEN